MLRLSLGVTTASRTYNKLDRKELANTNTLAYFSGRGKDIFVMLTSVLSIIGFLSGNPNAPLSAFES
jgi:hypothetical protein